VLGALHSLHSVSSAWHCNGIVGGWTATWCGELPSARLAAGGATGLGAGSSGDAGIEAAHSSALLVVRQR